MRGRRLKVRNRRSALQSAVILHSSQLSICHVEWFSSRSVWGFSSVQRFNLCRTVALVRWYFAAVASRTDLYSSPSASRVFTAAWPPGRFTLCTQPFKTESWNDQCQLPRQHGSLRRPGSFGLVCFVSPVVMKAKDGSDVISENVGIHKDVFTEPFAGKLAGSEGNACQSCNNFYDALHE